jgi:hypothetical protein
MNSAMLVSLVMGLLPGFLLFTLVYAITVKALERRLTFVQSLLISAVASAISIVLLVAYYFVKVPLGLNVNFDSFAILAMWCVLGTIITRLARNYDIKKHGWLGLGAKANLWLLLVSWVLFGGFFIIKSFIVAQ